MIKKELRSRYRSVRDNVDNRELKSDIIARTVIDSELFIKSKEVFIYSASGSEVFTKEISDTARRLGKRIAYPKCIDRDGEMEFYFVDSLDDLSLGMYGIFEPDCSESEIAVPSSIIAFSTFSANVISPRFTSAMVLPFANSLLTVDV